MALPLGALREPALNVQTVAESDMATWVKETDSAIYLMEGGYYISKIAKRPSKNNPQEKVVNVSAMKSWFTRPDAPRGMTVSLGIGPEPSPKPAIAPPPPDPDPPTGSTQKINADGIRLIKSFEGLRLTAYQDSVGVWTIGYGTTRGVTPGMTISTAQAEQFLRQDVAKFEEAIRTSVKVPLNDNQFSALVVFTYNVGSGAFRNSTLLKKLNAKDYTGAADEFLRWNKAGGKVLAGLTRRRNAERALFLSQDFTKFL